MHIPENYLSPSTCAVMTAAMLPIWVAAVQKVKKEIPQEKMPLLGIGAAFCFLGMMFNIPLPGGTTGHAVGGTLSAILLGPYAACIVITTALFVQALLFGDGGILAFGANCFNMAFVLPFFGYGVYRVLSGQLRLGRLVSAGVGAYVGINAAAFCAAIEFGIQPLFFQDALGQALYCPYPLAVSVPAMMLGHLGLFGFAEAAFTVGILTYIEKTAPGFFGRRAQSGGGMVYGLLAALICLSPLGLLAEGTAWGEWAPEEIAAVVTKGAALGYTPRGLTDGLGFAALFPDYTVGGMPEWSGYVLSAVIGFAAIVILFKVLGVFMKDKANGRRDSASL